MKMLYSHKIKNNLWCTKGGLIAYGNFFQAIFVLDYQVSFAPFVFEIIILKNMGN